MGGKKDISDCTFQLQAPNDEVI